MKTKNTQSKGHLTLLAMSENLCPIPSYPLLITFDNSLKYCRFTYPPPPSKHRAIQNNIKTKGMPK